MLGVHLVAYKHVHACAKISLFYPLASYSSTSDSFVAPHLHTRRYSSGACHAQHFVFLNLCLCFVIDFAFCIEHTHYSMYWYWQTSTFSTQSTTGLPFSPAVSFL